MRFAWCVLLCVCAVSLAACGLDVLGQLAGGASPDGGAPDAGVLPGDAAADVDLGDAGVDGAGPDGAPPLDPVAACGRPSTYVDDFSDGVIAPEWATGALAGSTVTEIGGQIVIASAAAGGGRLESRFAVNLSDDRLRVEVPSPPTGGATAVLAARAFTGGGELSFGVAGGNLTLRVADPTPSDIVVPYDPTAHRWWQLVEAAGQVRWETSPDGVAWTVRRTAIATPAFAKAVRITLESRAPVTAGEARFDRVNAGRPRAPWCKASTLVDDFNDALTGPQWLSIEQGACSTAEANGEVRFFTNTSGPSSTCVYASSAAYDLTGSAVFLEIPAITNYAAPIRFLLRAADASGRAVSIGFTGAGGQLFETGEGLSPQLTGYGQSAEDWWRLREAGGTFFWETSGDGTIWGVERQAATPSTSLDAVRISVGVDTNATMPFNVSIGTPRLNVAP